MTTPSIDRLILVVLVAGALLAGAVPAAAQGQATDFTQAKSFQKLDGETQQAWKDAMGAQDPDRRFDCFVRVRAPADLGDQSFLESAGFVVRMFSGNVASGHMPAKAVQSVAGLPFVDSIRLAKTPVPSVKKVDSLAPKTP